MSTDDRARLTADLAAAEADVTRIRAENAKLSDAFRAEPTDAGKAGLRRAAAALGAARDRVDAAKVAIDVLERTGSIHGLIAEDGKVAGTVAVAVKGGASREEREAAIEAALNDELNRAAEELGVVLAAAPERYTRERPGRDAEGRIVLDVAGRVEGDRLTPAVSKAARSMRS